MVNNYLYQRNIVSSENYAILKNIAIEKYKFDSSGKKEITKTEKLVYSAAISVLKNMRPYLTGAKKISSSQMQKIEHAYDEMKAKISEAAMKREEKLAKKGHMLMAMVSRLREQPIAPHQPETFQKVMDGYIQVMGCVTAYGKWKKGDTILGPNPQLPSYEVHDVIKNSKGLQIVVLTPKGKSPEGFPPMPPILCCRGTVPSKTHNIIDDLNEHIGQHSFQASKDQIRQTLKEVSESHGPTVMTGHSLGGAIAQAITEDCCDQNNALGQPTIQSTYHYNAPGVGDAVAARFAEKVKQLPIDKKPKIISYHHRSDIVSLAGGAHLKADVRHEVGTLTKNVLAAHSFHKLISEIGSKIVDTAVPLKRRIIRGFTEGIRRIVAKIGLLSHFLTKALHQNRLKTRIQEMVRFIQTPSHIRHEIIKKHHEQEIIEEQQRQQRAERAENFANRIRS